MAALNIKKGATSHSAYDLRDTHSRSKARTRLR